MALTPEQREELLYGAIIEAVVEGTLDICNGVVVGPVEIFRAIKRTGSPNAMVFPVSVRVCNVLAASLVESHEGSLHELKDDVARFEQIYGGGYERISLNARPIVRACIDQTTRVIQDNGCMVERVNWIPCTPSLDLAYVYHQKIAKKSRLLNDALAVERFVEHHVDKLSLCTLIDHVETMKEFIETNGASGKTAAALNRAQLREFCRRLYERGALEHEIHITENS